MTAEYKKFGNGDVEGGVVTPFLDEPKTDFAQVPLAQTMGKARYAEQPNDYLVFAIITTMFCCIPCGIVAIVRSLDVRTKWLNNDIVGATKSSRAAKRYSMCSLVFGILGICIWSGLIVASTMSWLQQSGMMDQIIQQAQVQQQAMLQAQQDQL